MRELDKDKKIFIVIGIPIFIFLGLFFATHYFQISALFIVLLIIAALGLLRKRGFWRCTVVVLSEWHHIGGESV